MDVSYLNVAGTFYYLCSVLDGFSRSTIHWDIRTSMTEADIELILERAKEGFSQACRRVISNNGPQFITRDFKKFIRLSGMTQVRTSPFYPQSNGKIERWDQFLKAECLRPGCSLSLEGAHRLVERYVEHYNTIRLPSEIASSKPPTGNVIVSLPPGSLLSDFAKRGGTAGLAS